MSVRKSFKAMLPDVVAFCIFINIAALVFASFGQSQPWPLLPLAFVVVFFSFLRRHCKGLLAFVLLHFLTLGLPIVALLAGFGVWGAIAVGVFVLLSIIYSLKLGSGGIWALDNRAIVISLVVFLSISLIYFQYFGHYLAGMRIFLNIGTIVSLASVVCFMHMDNLEFNLGLLSESHRKLAANTMAINNSALRVFLLIILGLATLSVIFSGYALVFLILQGIWAVLAFIGSGIQWLAYELWMSGYAPVGQDDLAAILEAYGGGAGEVYTTYAVEEPWISMLLLFISRYIFPIIAIGIIVLLVIAGAIARLRRSFRIKNESDKAMDAFANDLEGIAGLDQGYALVGRAKSLGLWRPKNAVRRAYIKKIKAHIKQGFVVMHHYAPDTIAAKLKEKEDIAELTELYKEARYGKQ